MAHKCTLPKKWQAVLMEMRKVFKKHDLCSVEEQFICYLSMQLSHTAFTQAIMMDQEYKNDLEYLMRGFKTPPKEDVGVG